MKNLKEAWPSICDYSVRLDLPPSRWKYEWSTHRRSAQRLYNAIRLSKPQIIVETGTFEGLGTYTMAKAAAENDNGARIFTVDYDGDPEEGSIPMEDWLELRRFREENLELARKTFPNVEIVFLNGDSRQVLPTLLPSRISTWDFFFQDSMHFTSGILDEWRIMRPYAHSGSIVVFDDVCLDWKQLPEHLLGRKKFCLHFVFHEAWKNGWQYQSTVEGRAQFWARKS
jgi:cephalosporin hydroxylase